MKKMIWALLLLTSMGAMAQDDNEEEERKGFQKENLFAGGSLSLSFGNNSFLIGGNPTFGYSITRWADLGIVGNYQHTSFRDYSQFNDRLRQNIIGGGVYTRIYPVRFLFVQGQIERNWITLKYIPPANGGATFKEQQSGSSVLVGAGLSTGRDPDNKGVFGYLSLLYDVKEAANSPYTDANGRSVPIVRAGIQIPLFQPRFER